MGQAVRRTRLPRRAERVQLGKLCGAGRQPMHRHGGAGLALLARRPACVAHAACSPVAISFAAPRAGALMAPASQCQPMAHRTSPALLLFPLRSAAVVPPSCREPDAPRGQCAAES